MKFVFTCPLAQRPFFSADFQFTENRGIAVDDAGNRYLDARIRLTSPCPFCGQYHAYRANELACPFSAGEEKK